MAYRYSDDMYSNSSRSSRSGGGTWVYMNGELYHEGKKGMHWYQHMPGTDYWKTFGKKVKSAFTEGSKTIKTGSGMTLQRGGVLGGIANAAKTAFGTLGRGTRNYFRNEADYYGNKAKDKLLSYQKADYGENKSQNKRNLEKSKSLSNLDLFADKQMRDVQKFVDDIKAGNKSWSNIINLAIQNAQFNIVNGVNSFLKKRGWDDEVDRLISKFTGRSGLHFDNKKTSKTLSKGKHHLNRTLTTPAVARSIAKGNSADDIRKEQRDIRERNKPSKPSRRTADFSKSNELTGRYSNIPYSELQNMEEMGLVPKGTAKKIYGR